MLTRAVRVSLPALSLSMTLYSGAALAQTVPPTTVSNPPVPEVPRDSTAAGAVRASERTEFGASGSPPSAAETGSGFAFGSYGRVGLGTDLRGHSGYGVNIVSHGSRLEEPSYLELNFYYGGTIGDDPQRRWRVVVVPAFAGDLFHYTGNFTTQNFALRNAYAETENLLVKGLRLWAGSRMYRGDDVYLFDFWPLDNLNTVGGGVGYRFNHERTDIAWHIGMNRLDNLYQYQTLTVPSPTLPPDSVLLTQQQATTTAVTLDRPRVVTSLKLTHYLRSPSAVPNAKFSLYAEFHYLPGGLQQPDMSTNAGGRTPLVLPQDYGWVVGAQVGGWLRPFVFANVFFRASGGLGAFGDLGLPYGFANDLTLTAARDLMLAFSLNWESHVVGIMSGGYVHSFHDASAGDDSGFTEGALAVRPQFYATRYFHVATELSYQVRAPATVFQSQVTQPQVFRASVMPVVAPLGRGTYSRPFIYAIYTLSLLNSDAQATLFPAADVRGGHTDVHYLGLGAEWWFNSSYR